MLVNNVQRYSNPGIESQVCLNFMPVSVVSSTKIQIKSENERKTVKER